MPEKRNVLVCQGTGCRSGGAEETMASLQGEIATLNLEDSIQVKQTGCHGFCQRGPLVVVEPEGTFYSKVGPDDVGEIAQSLLPEGRTVERLLYHDPTTD